MLMPVLWQAIFIKNRRGSHGGNGCGKSGRCVSDEGANPKLGEC